MMTEKLAYGASWLVPDTATAAWGARLIIDQTGWVDLVHDRQDLVGDVEAKVTLVQHLRNSHWRAELERELKDGWVQTRVAREVTLYEDDTIIVRGNSNGSHGYFYVAAWIKPTPRTTWAEPDADEVDAWSGK